MFLYRKVLVVSVLQSANVMMAIQQMHFAFTYIQNLACLVDFLNPTKVYFSLFNSSHFFDKFFLSVLVKCALGQHCSSYLCGIISMDLKDVSKHRLKLTITVEKESMVPKQCMVLV